MMSMTLPLEREARFSIGWPLLEQLLERRLVVVLEFLRIEVAGFLLDDVLCKVEHVLGDLYVLNLIEIFRCVADLVGISHKFTCWTKIGRWMQTPLQPFYAIAQIG